MIRSLYNWVLRQAETPYALWTLAFVSFIESSMFPIPPDVLMIPMIIAAPRRAWLIAGVATVSSVLGGALGYYIGWGLFESVGRPVLEFYGKADAFDLLAESYNQQGFWAVLIAGVTPFPYKVITIFSGLTGLNFALFMATSVLARGLRFFIIAALLHRFGEPIRDFIDRRLGLVATVSVALLIGGFAIVKYAL
ncbi:DedA family protein [Albimonas sp. CAU 1670]|uniref:YqaA family protein n=1 Tax=Albimonas sp. CAU 1670 TaxID=3032599 RepID=UPI0023DBB492|nr:YqaA family protein [Albimonas sp. CAU 1670]MDF2232524.1 DedA family protein [Albimonas sp. CAU 1670]